VTADLREELQGVVGGTYELQRELGGGGMSRLFLATDRSLRRPVVIKVLPPERTSTVNAIRFQREIELAAQLQHPHILPIHAAGARDGLLYYVMPYVPGESLRHRLIRERKLPLSDALRIVREVADALAYAHHLGVIHRDIKPENVLLAQGHALLADFGIARARAEVRSAPGTDGRLTDSGVAMGTPGYMAPEQVAGDRGVDGRADIYALGVVAYEMLAGTPPFTGPTAQAIITAHLTRTPPEIRWAREDVPRPLAHAIRTALEKDPELRFRTAADFRDALDQAEAETADRRARNVAARLLERVFGGVRKLRASRRSAPPSKARAATVSPTTVAVFPFAVRGSPRLSYLGDGMVDLLSTRLDGAGELRSADPRAVLGIVEQHKARVLEPARARRIADQLGAGQFVLGSLLEAGGRVQVTASLYGPDGSATATATATAADEAGLFDLVDTLAIQLLSGDSGNGRSALSSLAATTTSSLPALKAYLDGERHLRQGRFTLARESLHRAADEDPGFSLAWYRLSVAAEWLTDRELQDLAAERALRTSDRLPERERQLLQAFVAWRRGSPRAEAMYRAIIGAYPNAVEAWIQLGEVLFHYGPLSGRPISDSREAWERVLAFEPDHLGALHHLARVASVEGRRAELSLLTDRVLSLSPQSEKALEAQALRAFGLGDPEEQERVIAELRLSSDAAALGVMRTVATYTDNLAGAATVARTVTTETRAGEVCALAHVFLAYLEVARGRWRAAREELQAAARSDLAWGLEARAQLATIPFLPWSVEELRQVRDELLRWRASEQPPRTTPSLFVRAHNGLHAHIRCYLLALLSARLGEETAASRHAADLVDLPGSALQRALAHCLSEHVRAELAAQRGNAPDGLDALSRTELEVGYELPLASPLYSRAGARFLRATLSQETGCHDEALRWLASFDATSVYDLIYVAPALVRRGALLERLGRQEAAVASYRRAVALWLEHDDELAAIIAPATERLAALGLGARTGAARARRPGFEPSPDVPVGA
jgi:serine/threonine protein kinase/tetratricopeptide (TPR) repeat protein